MFKWLEKRRQDKRAKRKENGYNCAAGYMLREGRRGQEQIADCVAMAKIHGDYDAFDEGAEEAMRDYDALRIHYRPGDI